MPKGFVLSLVTAFVGAFAPVIQAMTCGCGGHESSSRATSCCGADEPEHDSGPVAPGERDHSCPNRGDSCCCERAHDAMPVEGGTTAPAAHALIVLPVALDTWIPSAWRGVMRPFGRARCRDGPNIFVLNSLRL